MITAIIILSVLLLGTILFLISCIMHILKIQKELMDISKEQHIQNKDIMELMKGRIKTIEFQTNQFELNKEIARSFEYLNDRELIRNLQDIDPRKIAQA